MIPPSELITEPTSGMTLQNPMQYIRSQSVALSTMAHPLYNLFKREPQPSPRLEKKAGPVETNLHLSQLLTRLLEVTLTRHLQLSNPHQRLLL
jgi:hypothetical protein